MIIVMMRCFAWSGCGIVFFLGLRWIYPASRSGFLVLIRVHLC